MAEENQPKTVPFLDNIRDYTILYNYVDSFRQIQLQSGEIYDKIAFAERSEGKIFDPKKMSISDMIKLIHKYPNITHIGTANEKKLAQIHRYAQELEPGGFPTQEKIDQERARYQQEVHKNDLASAAALKNAKENVKVSGKEYRRKGWKVAGAVGLGVLGAVLTGGVIAGFGAAVWGVVTTAATLSAGITSGLAVGGLVVGVVAGRLIYNGLSKMFSKIKSVFDKAKEERKSAKKAYKDFKKELRKEKAQRRLLERSMAFDKAYNKEPYRGQELFNENAYDPENDQETEKLPPIVETEKEREDRERREREREARRRQRQQQNSLEEEMGDEETSVEIEDEDSDNEEIGKDGDGTTPTEGKDEDEDEEELDLQPTFSLENVDEDDLYSEIEKLEKEDARLGRKISHTAKEDKKASFEAKRKANAQKLEAYNKELDTRVVTDKIANGLLDKVNEDESVIAEAKEALLKNGTPKLTVGEYRKKITETIDDIHKDINREQGEENDKAYEAFKYGKDGLYVRKALENVSDEYLESVVGLLGREGNKVGNAMQADATGSIVWGAERLDDKTIQYITAQGKDNFGQFLVAELLEERKATKALETGKVFEERNKAFAEYKTAKAGLNEKSTEAQKLEAGKKESVFRMYDRELDTRDLSPVEEQIVEGMSLADGKSEGVNWDRESYKEQVDEVVKEINKKETIGELKGEVKDKVRSLERKREKAYNFLEEQEAKTLVTENNETRYGIPAGVKFNEYEGALVLQEAISKEIISLEKQIADLKNENKEELANIIEKNRIKVVLNHEDVFTRIGVPAPEAPLERISSDKTKATQEEIDAFVKALEEGKLPEDFGNLYNDEQFRGFIEQVRINSYGRRATAEGLDINKSLEELGREADIISKQGRIETQLKKSNEEREKAFKDGLIKEEDVNDKSLFIVADNEAAIDAGYQDDYHIVARKEGVKKLLDEVITYNQNVSHMGLDGKEYIATKEGLEKAVANLKNYMNELSSSREANIENAEEPTDVEELDEKIELTSADVAILVDSLSHRLTGEPPKQNIVKTYEEGLGEKATIEEAQEFLDALEKEGKISDIDTLNAREDFAKILNKIRINMPSRPGEKDYNVEEAKKFFDEKVAKSSEIEEQRNGVVSKLQGYRQKAVDSGLYGQDLLKNEGACPCASSEKAQKAGFPTEQEANALFAELAEVETTLHNINHKVKHGDHIATKAELESAVEEAKSYLRAFIMEKQTEIALENAEKDETIAEKAKKGIKKGIEAIKKVVPKKKPEVKENSIVTKDMLDQQFEAQFKNHEAKGKVTNDILGARGKMIASILGGIREAEKISGVKAGSGLQDKDIEAIVDSYLNERKEFKDKWYDLVAEKQAELDAAAREPKVSNTAAAEVVEAEENKKKEERDAILEGIIKEDAEESEENSEKVVNKTDNATTAQEDADKKSGTEIALENATEEKQPVKGEEQETVTRATEDEEQKPIVPMSKDGFEFETTQGKKIVVPFERMAHIAEVIDEIEGKNFGGNLEEQRIKRFAGDKSIKLGVKYVDENGEIVKQGKPNSKNDYEAIYKAYKENKEAYMTAIADLKKKEEATAGVAQKDKTESKTDTSENKPVEPKQKTAETATDQNTTGEQVKKSVPESAEKPAEPQSAEENAQKQAEEARKAKENAILSARMTVTKDGFEFKNNKGRTFVVPYDKMKNISKVIEELESKEWEGNREEKIASRLAGTRGIERGIKYRHEVTGEIVKQGSVSGYDNFEQIYKTYNADKERIEKAIEAEDQRKAQEAEEKAKAEAEEKAKAEAEERAKAEAEAEARKNAEIEAQKIAEEAQRKAQEEQARKQAEVEAKEKAEAEARAKAEEEARKAKEAKETARALETARKRVEEEAKQTAEKETQASVENKANAEVESSSTESSAEIDTTAKKVVKEKPKSPAMQAIEDQLRSRYAEGGKLTPDQLNKALSDVPGLTPDEVISAQGIHQGLEAERKEKAKAQKLENLRNGKEAKNAQQANAPASNQSESGSEMGGE